MIKRGQSGVALVTVVCFMAALTVLAAGLMMESSTHIKLAMHQTQLEQALYSAAAGVEHAVSYIVAGGTAPSFLNGTAGDGTYIATIMDDGSMSGTVSGSAQINPNNRTDNEFTLLTGTGATITRDDLHQDKSDFACAAVYIKLKPAGNGNQNTLIVNGSVFNLQNSKTYIFSGPNMAVNVWNDNRNPQGKALGKWFIAINGTDIAIDDGSTTSAASTKYKVISIGSVNNISRALVIEGLQRQSWARYALWYNTDAYGCWFKNGEKFYGPVHANCMVNFNGDPEFFSDLTTAHHTYGGSTNPVTFHGDFVLNAPTGRMSDVEFSELKDSASLILTGRTSVTFDQTNILVSNSRHGWVNHQVPIDDDKTIYISTASSGYYRDGLCTVGGEVKGRVTLVAEHDIHITNHVTYSVHPTNSSTDAIGLIANRNVMIASSAPNNLNVFAHIMATGNITPNDHTSDGKFWVEQYDSYPPKGILTVYGGIVQDTRGPVGTFDTYSGMMSSGFEKNYHFDTRFSQDPPPNYPTITNLYQWTSWRDIALYE